MAGKWPLKEIERDRNTYALEGKTDIWYRNKMCECISPDSQKFKREYFKYYEIPPKLHEMNIYTAVDLAISEKPNADFSAIVTVGVNPAGHWFILDVEYGRYDPSTTMDAVFSAVQKWRPLGKTLFRNPPKKHVNVFIFCGLLYAILPTLPTEAIPSLFLVLLAIH